MGAVIRHIGGMPIIPITAPDDPRITPYTSIREKDLTRGHGARFIVEGKVTLATLLTRARFAPESIFVAESRLTPLADLLARVPAHVPIYSAAQSMMDRIVGFPIHRGVLACGWKGTPNTSADLLTNAQTVLCLIGLSNHDNIGACFRNAAAFGGDAILLDKTSGDPLYRKSIRVSAGAALTLPFAQDLAGDDLLDALTAAGFEIWCLTPRADAAPLNRLQRPKKLALVLGPEGPGLPDHLIMRGKAVRIPMVQGFDSINVATAGAIAMSAVFNR